MARSHVHARGGNALVGFRIKDLDIIDNVHKNQAQCLLAIQGANNQPQGHPNLTLITTLTLKKVQQ